MKRIATLMATAVLMLNLGVASIYAQQRPVTMTFSGNGATSAINLNYSNTHTVEENVAGDGALGSFTFRDVRAASNSPQTVPPTTCPSSDVFFPSGPGGGIFRFQDGSLLKVSLVQGGDCIDFVHFVARCTLTLQITGGTGRFQGVSGVLTFTETAVPVLADASGNVVLGTETGEITGTISGVTIGNQQQDEQQ